MLLKIVSFFRYCYKIIKYSLLILQLLLTNKALLAQKVDFNHITVENGLSNNSILAITQDKVGFMWFGSRNGLNRYDGINFKTYQNIKNDIKSLPSNYIISILCDSKNTLWVGSEFGLSKYITKEDNFERITLENGSNAIIYCLLEDKEGNIWVGTSDGLYNNQKDKDSEKKIFKKVKNNLLIGTIIRSIYQDKNGKFLTRSTINSNYIYHKYIFRLYILYQIENLIHAKGKVIITLVNLITTQDLFIKVLILKNFYQVLHQKRNLSMTLGQWITTDF